MLFRCNYVALVIAPSVHPTATQSQENTIGHKVVIWDDLKQRGVIQLEFNAEVRAVTKHCRCLNFQVTQTQ